jgi:putative peptidoglycan lipid II flippase
MSKQSGLFRDDYRHTLIVMFGLVAATLTGYLRQAAIAHHLGAGRTADVFLVAFAVPEFVFIALPIVLGPAFIPLFAERRLQQGDAGAWRFALQVAVALLVVLLLLTLVAGLAAPLYLPWLGPGLDGPEVERAVTAARRMLPALSFMGLATLAGAVLQVYRRFGRPALATAAYNLTLTLVLFLAPLARPLGRAAWGVTLGAAAALLLQLPLVWRHRLSALEPPRAGTAQTRSIRAVARLAAPLAAGYAVHHLILFVDRAMATQLGAGRAAALSYAYHLALVVGQVSGLAVSTVLFPRLAEQVAAGKSDRVRESLAGALRFVAVVGIPAAAALILLRVPLVQLLFEHGAFDAAATAAVAAPLVWYAVAVLADAFCQPLWRVIYARRRMWTVLGVNGLQTGVRLLANVVLTRALGYNGLALSAVLGLAVQLVTLAWLTRRYTGPFLTTEVWRDGARIVAATALAVGAMGLTMSLLPALSPLATTLTSGLAGTLVYIFCLYGFCRRSGKQIGDYARNTGRE